jgi:tRNA1Val (adenine37-N6)-methyltransferase
MSNNYFSFKHFTIFQDRSAFKVGTDAVLLGVYADISGKKHILDIGTGTGVIALMLAQRSDAVIVAIEPDRESFKQASENFRKSKWPERITLENAFLQDYFPADLKFDLIVTNPPYFIDSLKNPDPVKSRTRHDVTLTHSDIFEGVFRLLERGGTLQLILPYAEGNVFIAEAREFGFFCNGIVKIRPTPSSEIRRLILSFSRERRKVTERFLTIESGKRHDFTEEYKELTKDFYLKF